MRMTTRKNSGVTLIEMLIGIVVTSLMVGILLSFYSSGVRGSQKGMEHLNNMGIASILMSQIEYDLMRASRFLVPSPGKSDNAASWEFPADSSGGIGTITYRLVPEGIEREERRSGELQKYVYCKGRTVTLSFDNLQFTSAAVASDKSGVLVALFVASPPKAGEVQEEFKLIRLISLRNLVR